MTPLAVSVEQAVALSGLSKSTIHERIKSGDLSSAKVGSRRVVHYASLCRLIGIECAADRPSVPGTESENGTESGMELETTS